MQFEDKKIKNGILWILILLSVVAAVNQLLIGFDIDEGYAVSMPFRLLQGDHLFADMWEVHQTSALLPAAFLWLFYQVTGSTAYMVLYLRIVATLLHLGMTVLIYRKTRKYLTADWSLLFALLYLNLLPKWIISLDFSMQQVWGLTLLFTCLLEERGTEKKQLWQDFLAGLSLAFTVLAYPGMVLLYPAVLVMICMCNKALSGKDKCRKCLLFTAGCAVCAVVFFLYILLFMPVADFLSGIPKVFMDGTHQFTMQTKLLLYGQQWLNVAKQLLILSVLPLLAALILQIFRQKKRKEKGSLFLAFLLLFVAETSLLMILGNLVGIQMGPFHFQVRYLLFFLCICIAGWNGRNTDRPLFYVPIFLMLVAFVGILVFSNVGPDSSSSYLGLGILAGFSLLLKKYPQKEQLLFATTVLFVLSLLFCKGYYVRITEYGPSTVRQQRVQVTEGALAGIYVLPEEAEQYMQEHETVQCVTQPDDKLLFLGTDGILNLSANCPFVSPSTISTPAFNEQWVEYFTEYPEKEPTVIVLAKNTIDNREKFFAQNPFGKWIAEKYDRLHMEETESLCIIKKEKSE
ncbi:MAG: hypothetical protein SOZ88_02075 [Lachnospiraceae bacterium]|nr:hypothetical protein [Lachnospiraceae bacterium]